MSTLGEGNPATGKHCGRNWIMRKKNSEVREVERRVEDWKKRGEQKRDAEREQAQAQRNEEANRIINNLRGRLGEQRKAVQQLEQLSHRRELKRPD